MSIKGGLVMKNIELIILSILFIYISLSMMFYGLLRIAAAVIGS
jgi:hypothetical protein